MPTTYHFTGKWEDATISVASRSAAEWKGCALLIDEPLAEYRKMSGAYGKW